MSEQIAVRFLRDWGRYTKGDMTSLGAQDVPRLLLKQVVMLVERTQTIEAATVAPAEAAVTRRQQ